MTLRTSVQTKAAALNGQLALINNGSELKIYAGTAPASTTDAITTQTLLSTHTFSSTPFPATSTATATANAIASAVAVASGTASFYRIEDAANVVHRQGSVGLSGSGAELIIDNVGIVEDGDVNITSYTVTQG